MAATRAAIRAAAGRLIGDGFAITMSGGSTTTAESTGFERFALSANDVLNREAWLAMTTLNSVANSFEESPAEDYATDTPSAGIGRVTVPTAFTATVANADIGELWRKLRPSLVNDGITSAIRWLNGMGLTLPIYDETIVVDRLAGTNLDFQTFAAANFTGWTLSGAGASVAEETNRVWFGDRNPSITAGGAAVARYEQNFFNAIEIKEWVGKTFHLEVPAWATAASIARVFVTFDGTFTGSNFFASSYHAGDDEWEVLDLDASIPAGATEASVGLEVAAGGTGIFGPVRPWIRPIYRYALPSTIVTRPRQVFMERDRKAGARNTVWDLLTDLNIPRSGHRIRILGRGRLTEPTGETSSVEVSAEFIDLLAWKALSYAFKAYAGLRSANRDELEAEAAHADNEAMRLLDMGVKVKVPPLVIPRGYRTEYSGETTRYLELTARRG